MHILLTANSCWNILNFRSGLVRHLLGLGHRITVLSPDDDSRAEITNMGCRFLPLQMDLKGLNPLRDMQLCRELWRIFRRENPDIILSYTIKNNIFGTFAARSCGIPFVPNVTGLGTAFLSGPLLQRLTTTLYRAAFRSLPCVFFQNTDDRQLFCDLGILRPDQAELLPGSGIDLQHFSPRPAPADQDKVTFLMVSRLLRDKGVAEFVGAAAKIRALHPQTRFQLLGARDVQNRSAIDAPTLQGWIDSGIVDYLEPVRDIRPAIAAADCVVLPSYREGAPRTLIEAAAMARPVIASDVPGCRAVVDHRKSGYLCAARSSDELAEMMARFIAMPVPDRAAMGRAGRQKMVSEFDERIVIASYCDAIDRLTRPAVLAEFA